MSRRENWDCMYDCIHLKACRRVQRIGKNRGLKVPRYCYEECSAYVSGKSTKFIPEEDVDEMINEITDYIMSGVDSVRDGCDPYDVYCSYDLVNYMPKGKSLDEIIEDQYEVEL